MNRPVAPPVRRGFTLVEILVVIGIIALLLGILLVGLRSAFGTANKTRELSSLRQVFYAWNMYSSGSDDYVLPGYLDENTQDKWNVDFKDIQGNDLIPANAAPWSWRLAGYTDNSWDLMVGYRQDFDEDLATVPLDIVANEPAFGYNAFYMGGWWETPTMADNPMARFDNLPAPYNKGIICRSQGNIDRPDQQLVFAASTVRASGLYENTENTLVPGAHWVVPPFLGATEVWDVGFGGSPTMDVFAAEGVPLNRYTSAVGAVTADGATQSISVDALKDMRRWVNGADAKNWQHVD